MGSRQSNTSWCWSPRKRCPEHTPPINKKSYEERLQEDYEEKLFKDVVDERTKKSQLPARQAANNNHEVKAAEKDDILERIKNRKNSVDVNKDVEKANVEKKPDVIKRIKQTYKKFMADVF
jgi:hypothetical protein